MALTWNFQDSEYSSWSKKKQNKNWSVAQSLIWLTMGVDFNMREGEKDIDEFLWRARCYELLNGAYLVRSCKHKSDYLDPETGLKIRTKCKGHIDEKTGVRASGKGTIPTPLTRKMIAPYAGLDTNVIRLPRRQWLTKIKKQIAEDATESLRRSESFD